VTEKYTRVDSGENIEEIINKYDSYSVVSPGNYLLPEYGEALIYQKLLNNGYGNRKLIVNNEEYIITPELLTDILLNFAIYDYNYRRYYVKITELLGILQVETQNISNIEFGY
jgi:hypothetical protein